MSTFTRQELVSDRVELDVMHEQTSPLISETPASSAASPLPSSPSSSTKSYGEATYDSFYDDMSNLKSISHDNTLKHDHWHSHNDPNSPKDVNRSVHQLPDRPLPLEHSIPQKKGTVPPYGKLTLPPSKLLCYYFYHQGYCNRRRNGCLFAHSLKTLVEAVAIPPSEYPHDECQMPLCQLAREKVTCPPTQKSPSDESAATSSLTQGKPHDETEHPEPMPLKEPGAHQKICFFFYHKGTCNPGRKGCQYIHSLDTPTQEVARPPYMYYHNKCELPLCRQQREKAGSSLAQEKASNEAEHPKPMPPSKPAAHQKICFFFYHYGNCMPGRDVCPYIHSLDTPVQEVQRPNLKYSHSECQLPLCPLRQENPNYTPIQGNRRNGIQIPGLRESEANQGVKIHIPDLPDPQQILGKRKREQIEAQREKGREWWCGTQEQKRRRSELKSLGYESHADAAPVLSSGPGKIEDLNDGHSDDGSGSEDWYLHGFPETSVQTKSAGVNNEGESSHSRADINEKQKQTELLESERGAWDTDYLREAFGGI